MISDSEIIDHTHPITVYSIAHFQLGVAIRGDIPTEILNNFIEFFRTRYSYTTLDAIIAEYLEASYVFTNISKGKMWRKSLGIAEN